jgi:predicted membrane-bound mannosyltransferase
VHTIARSAFLSCAFLVLISLVTVFFRLGSLPLSGSDEPRYARIAQEMQQDHRWVTPTLEFKPWLEKPPLYYWITIPIYALLGTTEATARLGPAILALTRGAADQIGEAIRAKLAQHNIQSEPHVLTADNLGAKGWSLPA